MDAINCREEKEINEAAVSSSMADIFTGGGISGTWARRSKNAGKKVISRGKEAYAR